MLSCYSIVFWLSPCFTNLKCTCTGPQRCTRKLARQIQRSKRCYTLKRTQPSFDIDTSILYILEHWCKYSLQSWTLVQVSFTVLNIDASILYSLKHWCKYSLQSLTLMQVFFTVFNIDASILYSLEHWCKNSLQSWTLMQVSFTVLNIDASIL